MSIERNRWGFDGEITFECDGCGEELHTETAAFETALQTLKAERWRAKKENNNDWAHYCPSCQ